MSNSLEIIVRNNNKKNKYKIENIFLPKTRLDIMVLVVHVINSRKNFINVTIVTDVKFNYQLEAPDANPLSDELLSP